MRFAITAFNRKCIDAEEFDFELNNKLLIVCPNKGCSSPLTYVRTIDGQRYFRHPRRNKKELEDPKFQCERRAKGISAKAVKSYNKIVEQTTIQQFQKNFYKLIGCLHNWDDEALDSWRRRSTEPKFVKLMEKIDLKAKNNLSKHKKEFNEEFKNYEREINSKSDLEKFDEFKEETRKSVIEGLIYVPGTSEGFCIDPGSAVIAQLARNYVNVIEQNGTIFGSGGVSKEFYEKYPCLVEEQIQILPLVGRMLNHENSIKMRNFLLISGFCSMFIEYHEKYKEQFPNKPYFPTGSENVAITIGEYFQSLKEREDRPLNVIFSEIEEKLENQYKGTYFSFFPIWVSIFLVQYSADRYLLAANQMQESQGFEELSTKGNLGYIYLAYNDSLFKRGIDEEVKIGKTKSIPERSSSYQTYSSDGFVFERTWSVNNMHKAESFIHNNLKKYRIKDSGGKEWFNLSVDRARNLIGKIVSEYENKYGFFDGTSASGKGFA